MMINLDYDNLNHCGAETLVVLEPKYSVRTRWIQWLLMFCSSRRQLNSCGIDYTGTYLHLNEEGNKE